MNSGSGTHHIKKQSYTYLINIKQLINRLDYIYLY